MPIRKTQYRIKKFKDGCFEIKNVTRFSNDFDENQFQHKKLVQKREFG